MTTLNVALIENNKIVNIAVFNQELFEPSDSKIALSDLPEGCCIGWEKDINGNWYNPNTPPEPLPTPAVAPTVCSPAQGLVALYAVKGTTETDIQTAIASIPDPVQQYTANIAFSKATEWRRNSQSMLMLANLLSLTEQDLDELFTYAVTVTI